MESSSDDDSEEEDLDEHDEEFDMELAQLDKFVSFLILNLGHNRHYLRIWNGSETYNIYSLRKMEKWLTVLLIVEKVDIRAVIWNRIWNELVSHVEEKLDE